MGRNRVDEWMGRPYVRRVDAVPPEKGGGYIASVPQFGRYSLAGDGDTPTEALADLEERVREYFETLAARGEEPPPARVETDFPEEWPSGRLNLRLPRKLHCELQAAAAENGISLNSYIVQLLAREHGQEALARQLEQLLDMAQQNTRAVETAPSYSETQSARWDGPCVQHICDADKLPHHQPAREARAG